MGKTLVIVESPTKAKTIRKFLGKNFIVESCMGHIRDLPQSAKDIPEKFKKEKWATLGVDTDHDFSPLYCVPKNKEKVVSQLKQKLKEADELILATDEDREGESISWHLLEVLKPKVPVKRMVFHEITKTAIEAALKNFREIDFNLVRAQEARRILDRLVGYTISPLVWKKVAYGLSAGRVQSVAVKMICEKEMARLRFKKSSYWSLLAQCEKNKQAFEARLVRIANKKIATGKDFDGETGELFKDKKTELIILNEESAKALQNKVQKSAWKVLEVEESPVTRKPYAPFITSTLQQEANRKLGLSARDAMRTAQSLYEQGYITYMRTDSTFLSEEAVKAARKHIVQLYGKEYLPDQARSYAGKKVKGAQEAHEAIRPSGSEWPLPEDSGLADKELKLYELIWKRAMASQMTDAKQKRVSAKIMADDIEFVANGSSIEFPGFLRAYVEGSDDADAALEEREVHLPNLKVGDIIQCQKTDALSHETKAPARYTEASLVQSMEKEGIGRPSTYAPTIATIQERGYVRKEANALVPTFTALVVSDLLSKYFPKYVDLGFTSSMEKSLDEVADGDLDSIKYLKSIYSGKDGLKALVEKQDKIIKPEEAREIAFAGLENYAIRVGRYGAYVCRKESDGTELCASLPESQSPADINGEVIDKLIEQKQSSADAIGKDLVTGLPIYVLNGRYGPYVQLGDITDEEVKPKRVSLPPGMAIEAVDLEVARFLVSLPRVIGSNPATQQEIKVGVGRFGPYLFHNSEYRSIPKTESMFTISLEKAIEIVSQPKMGRGRAQALRELGKHPLSEDPISVFSGKYGPYIKCGKHNVSLPEGVGPEQITFEAAIELLKSKVEAKTTKEKKSAKKTTKAKTPKKSAKEESASVKATEKATESNAKAKAKTLAKTSESKDSAKADKKTVSKTVSKAVTKAKVVKNTAAPKAAVNMKKSNLAMNAKTAKKTTGAKSANLSSKLTNTTNKAKSKSRV